MGNFGFDRLCLLASVNTSWVFFFISKDRSSQYQGNSLRRRN
jgi:hypothetical protein